MKMSRQLVRHEFNNHLVSSSGIEEYSNTVISTPNVDDEWSENRYPNGWQRPLLLTPAIALVVSFSGPVLSASPKDYNIIANLKNIHFDNSIYDHRTASSLQQSTPEIVTAAAMIDDVRKYFGLNMAQAARVFDVSRATLYNHISSTDAPVQSYKRLYTFITRLKENDVHNVRGKIKSALIEGETLLDILYRSPLDLDRIEQACEMLTEVNVTESIDHGVDAVRSSIAGLYKN